MGHPVKAKAILVNNQSNPLSRVRSTARVTSTSPGAGAGAGLVAGWGRGSCCPPTPAAAWSSWPAPTPWCSTYTATAPTGPTHTGRYTRFIIVSPRSIIHIRVGMYKLLLSLGYYVLAVDYRGYGDSTNIMPSEETTVSRCN